MTRPAEQPQPTTGTGDSVETAFFADVDQAHRNHRLLAAMDATARWPAVQELRAWTEPAITRGDSDGMFPFDQYLELQIERGRTRHDAETYLDELRRQSSEGSLTLAVTMWAAIGTVTRHP